MHCMFQEKRQSKSKKKAQESLHKLKNAIDNSRIAATTFTGESRSKGNTIIKSMCCCVLSILVCIF